MSKTETRRGKVKRITGTDGMTFTTAVQYLIDKGFDVEEYDVEEEYIYSPTVAHVDGLFYEVIEDKSYDYADIFIATPRADETIDFHLTYYNGGCSFEEALSSAIRNMNHE